MRAHRAGNTLLITNLHKMVSTLESIPNLQTLRQQGCGVIKPQELKLGTKLADCKPE